MLWGFEHYICGQPNCFWWIPEKPLRSMAFFIFFLTGLAISVCGKFWIWEKVCKGGEMRNERVTNGRVEKSGGRGGVGWRKGRKSGVGVRR